MLIVGSESLRAPEVILQAGYGTEIDIWAIGCTVRCVPHASLGSVNLSWCITKVFEMLTGRWLFKPDVQEGDPWTVEDDLLAKMMEVTGERFTNTGILARSPKRDHFFDNNGRFLFNFRSWLKLNVAFT